MLSEGLRKEKIMPRINSGILNEEARVNAIQNKTFEQLNRNLQYNRRILFRDIDNTSIFSCEKLDPRGKPDIHIHYKDQDHYLSLKSGAAETVQAEDIRKFIFFLRKYNPSVKCQKTILLFQYGDRTLTGTGTEIRYSEMELRTILKKEIEECNRELNSNLQLIKDFVLFCLFEGNFTDLQSADYIYHGNPDYGVLCSKVQVEKHITRKSYSYLKHPHIGPLLYGPRARYIDFNDRFPERRHLIAFRWPRLAQDMDYISRRYEG